MAHHENKHSENHTKSYVAVWMALLFLTVVTVLTSYQDYGVFNILVAMLIATLKASLVCLIFMHLKYENKLNQVVFVSSLVFLAVFIGLTASDLLTRTTYVKATVHEVKGPEGQSASKMKALSSSTPELVAKGKELYAVNCVACHGVSGQGDGGAAASLNPKPRNYTSAEGWKNGRSPAQIFKTLTEGIPGGSMASFSTFSIEDRWALSHFVHSLTPDPKQSDTPVSLAAIGIKEGADASAVSEAPAAELPISFAIKRLIEEASTK